MNTRRSRRFKSDVEDNALTVTDDRITYTSSTLGMELSYDRIEDTAHEVNGVPVDWTEFDHGFQTPWSSNPYGSYQACVNKNGYSVTYDWDPDDDGDFDEMPTKTVDNDGAATPRANDDRWVRTPHALDPAVTLAGDRLGTDRSRRGRSGHHDH